MEASKRLQQLKNIAEPIRACRIALAPNPDTELGPPEVTLPSHAGPSLAVLPFVNLSADPEQDYMSNGLTLSLITALVKIPGLLLIGDIPLGEHGEKPLNPVKLGRELGVSHVLDGGIQRGGNKVRVTIRLTETSGARQVWAGQFDKHLDDIFAMQDEITRDVVEAMDVKLVSGEPGRIVHQALKAPEAIEAYYRGWSAIFQSSPDKLLEARYWFEETIRLEPGSSLGYALAAWTNCQIAHKGSVPDMERSMERAGTQANQALALGDVTGLPYLALAHLSLLRHNHDQALKDAEKALLERPSCDASFAVKASILNYLGHPQEAIPLARQAMRIAPVHPSFYPVVLATAAYNSGRLEEAVSTAQEALGIDPENVDALVILTASQVRMGRRESARKSSRRLLQIRPDFQKDVYVASQPYKDDTAREKLLHDLQDTGIL